MTDRDTNPDEESLHDLRHRIDFVDERLVALIEERQALIKLVAQKKMENKVPLYVPDREADLIRARRKLAVERGVSPDLVEDLLRRIIRESYRSQGDAGTGAVHLEGGPVTIIGGAQGMGLCFLHQFEKSGYDVRVLDRGDWGQSDLLLGRARLVIVSVPISQTVAVIRRLKGCLNEQCVLADLTSVKVEPLREMLAVHSGPVVGLHPMFGPKSGVFAKQVVVVCQGRNAHASQWLLRQLRLWGATLLNSDAERHDHMMAVIQAMRHFATFVYGCHLAEENIKIKDVLSFSSPIYRLELGMVGRLFAQQSQLYADIIFSSAEGRELAERYISRFSKALELWKSGDKSGFVTWFEQTKQWFGEYAVQFLHESGAMIEKSIESRDHLPHRFES